MSDHYAIYFEAKLRSMFVPVVELMYTPLAKKFPGTAFWYWIANEHPEYPFLKEFAMIEDDNIPFGALSHAPESWDPAVAGLHGDIWKVICTTPDYETMQRFFKFVLSPMAYEVLKCQVLKNRFEMVQPMLVQPEEKALSSLASDISMTELTTLGDYHPVAAFEALWKHSLRHKREWDEEALYLLDQVRSYDGMVKSPESFMRICETAFPELLGKGIPDTLKEILVEELAKGPMYDRR